MRFILQRRLIPRLIVASRSPLITLKSEIYCESWLTSLLHLEIPRLIEETEDEVSAIVPSANSTNFGNISRMRA